MKHKIAESNVNVPAATFYYRTSATRLFWDTPASAKGTYPDTSRFWNPRTNIKSGLIPYWCYNEGRDDLTMDYYNLNCFEILWINLFLNISSIILWLYKFLMLFLVVMFRQYSNVLDRIYLTFNYLLRQDPCISSKGVNSRATFIKQKTHNSFQRQHTRFFLKKISSCTASFYTLLY